MRILLSSLLTITLFGCQTPSVAEDEAASCGFPDLPRTAEECECAGATVRPDPGDGSAQCQEDEVSLGRIRFGIEGAVCCL